METNHVNFAATLHEVVEGDTLELLIELDDVPADPPKGLEIRVSTSAFFMSATAEKSDVDYDQDFAITFESGKKEGVAHVTFIADGESEGIQGIEAIYVYIYIPKALKNIGFDKGTHDRGMIIIRDGMPPSHQTAPDKEFPEYADPLPEGGYVFDDGTTMYISNVKNRHHELMNILMWSFAEMPKGSFIPGSDFHGPEDDDDFIYGYASTDNLESLRFYKVDSNANFMPISSDVFSKKGGVVPAKHDPNNQYEALRPA